MSYHLIRSAFPEDNIENKIHNFIINDKKFIILSLKITNIISLQNYVSTNEE